MERKPPTILCFVCGKRAIKFIETRLNGTGLKRFTFFHSDSQCTVDIESDNLGGLRGEDRDLSWGSKPYIDDKGD